MHKNLDDVDKKIKYIQEHIAEEVAPDVSKLFKQSVRYALVDWYNDYDSPTYKNTFNFMKTYNSAQVRGKKNMIQLSVDSGCMNSYPGWASKKFQPSTAFDWFFTRGVHGYEGIHQSEPPYLKIDRDIDSKFDGKLDKIIKKTMDKYLM